MNKINSIESVAQSCAECKEDFGTDRNNKPVYYTLFKSQLCWECFVEWRA